MTDEQLKKLEEFLIQLGNAHTSNQSTYVHEIGFYLYIVGVMVAIGQGLASGHDIIRVVLLSLFSWIRVGYLL